MELHTLWSAVADHDLPTKNGICYRDVWEATEWRQSFWAPVIYDTLCNVGSAAFAGARVLEIGFGSGRLSVLLARYGAHVVGIEKNAHACEQASRHAARAGVSQRCEFLVGDVMTHQGDYDFIVTKSVMFHLDNAPAYATWGRHFHRLLVPGGRYLGFENGRAGRVVKAFRWYRYVFKNWQYCRYPFICDETLRQLRAVFPDLQATPYYRWASTFPLPMVARVEHALQVRNPNAALVFSLVASRMPGKEGYTQTTGDIENYVRPMHT